MLTKETVLRNAAQDTFVKRSYSQAKINEISNSNLIQLVYWLDDGFVVRVGRQYRFSGDTQIALYPNMALNHYTGECMPPLSFLQRCLGYTFPQALYVLNHFYYKVAKAPIQQELNAISASSHAAVRSIDGLDLNGITEEDRLSRGEDLALRRTIAYLCNTRHISRDVVLHFIHHRYLMMDESYNLCFITYRDPLAKGEIIAITKKGTTGIPFECNLVKEPNTGFFYARKDALTTASYEEVFVFESVIDMLSYLSLLREGRIYEADHSENRCYISLNGANNRKYLSRLLLTKLSIQKVSLCLDNDQKGIEGAERLRTEISCLIRPENMIDLRERSLKLISAQHGYCKDWNDVLRLSVPGVLSEV